MSEAKWRVLPLVNSTFFGKHYYHPAFAIVKEAKVLSDKGMPTIFTNRKQAYAVRDRLNQPKTLLNELEK